MPVPEITVEQLAEKLKLPKEQQPVLIDVRRPDEHAFVSLPGAQLFPLQELGEHAEELEALKGQEVVVFCHHGIRSLHGAAYLIDLGVNASSLAGGIDRYSQRIDPSLPRY
jgi:rhodanese-related sulfurtransferase